MDPTTLLTKRAQKWGVRILYSQMQPEMQFQAKHVISHAMQNRSNEQEIAEEIKKYMDKKFFGGWHVIAGRGFGVNVTHEEGSFLRAEKNPLQFVVYRCAN